MITIISKAQILQKPSALYKEHYVGSVGAGYGAWTKIKQRKN